MSNKRHHNESQNDFNDWEREPRNNKPNSRMRRQARKQKRGMEEPKMTRQNNKQHRYEDADSDY